MDVAPRRQDLLAPRSAPLGGHGRHELVADLPLLGGPGVEAAVEQLRLRVAEQLQEPQRARRADAGALVVDHDLAIGVDAAGGELMLDDPEEGAHRRRIRVDQADAVEVEMHGAGQGAAGELLRRPEIDHERTGRADPLAERRWRDEQLRVGVAVGWHARLVYAPPAPPATALGTRYQMRSHQARLSTAARGPGPCRRRISAMSQPVRLASVCASFSRRTLRSRR